VIKYSLLCSKGDAFEAWFGAIADYDVQREKHQIECPHCGDTAISKAPMAPAIGMTKKQKRAAFRRSMVAKFREHVSENFDYVGENFTDEARRIAEGKIDERPIWGEASVADAKEMIEEGLPVAPLPDELAPPKPEAKKPKKLN
jgi:hypothetical protein